jgi:hypothetical protein
MKLSRPPQVIDMPMVLFSDVTMTFHPLRQIGHGRTHINIKSLPERNTPQSSDLDIAAPF